MKLQPRDRKKLVNAALGHEPCDLIIKSTQIVNVFTEEIYEGNIGIIDGFIAFVEESGQNTVPLKAKKIIDGTGKFAIPGLLDAHMHIESSMMTPTNFAKAVLPLGTTTIFADPHEAANVKGIEAVEYFIRQSQRIPMRQFFLAPSCVPSIEGIETSGANFKSKEINHLMSYDNVLGLGEIMDFVGVINNSDKMRSIMDSCLERNGFLQGHIMSQNIRDICAYLCGGAESDHESEYLSEVLDKLRAGMYVNARENSMSLNMEAAVEALKKLKTLPSNLTMCTDDIEPLDLIELGHINFVLNKAIELGLDPVQSIRAATLNIAREMGIRNLGAIAPGYAADILLIDNIKEVHPSLVICKGCIVAENKQLCIDIPSVDEAIERENTIQLPSLSTDDFKIKAPVASGTVATNVIHYLNMENSLTKCNIEDLPVINGYIDISHDKDLKYVTVIHRHGKSESKGIGIVRNIGTHVGTIATTVAHDSHNLVIIYDKAEEALLAANELKACGGGIICVKENEVLGLLKLPILGILSPLELDNLVEEVQKVKDAHRVLGLVERKNPLLRAAIIALPVVPNIKITDKGLVSVMDSKLIPLFPKFPDFFSK